MKTNIRLVLPLLLCIFGLSSCLTAGLEQLPAFEDAEITNFKFEHRWSISEGNSQKLQVKPMTVNLKIDAEQATITAKITVPAASGTFTEAVREQVSLKNIVGFCNLSTAASIKPAGESPKLGVPADFSRSPMTYVVTAADGKTTKEWKLIIAEFNK